MSAATVETVAPADQVVRQGFGDVLRAERIKLFSVRSTWWTLATLVGLGAGLTIVICAANAQWLASAEADEPVGSFITWGMSIAQIAALVLGVLVATSEYGTGMVRATFAAVPRRGRVLAAKSLLVAGLMLVLGTATALLGYLGGNYFLDREGIGVALEGDVLRSMYGNGLALAGFGLMGVAVGFLLRHTAGAITVLVGVVIVASNMAAIIPGEAGELIMKLMPGNAPIGLMSPEPFNPQLLDAWPGFAVFAAEVAALVGAAWWLLRRRDA